MDRMWLILLPVLVGFLTLALIVLGSHSSLNTSINSSVSSNIRQLREHMELLSNLVYGRPESGGLPARFFFLHPIGEPHVGDHVGQMTEAA